LTSHRSQVLASIGTRLALGAYPLVFVLVFGWAYGKEAFDTAAAANNWANYLNVLLLSGFVLVPPAVARLRGPDANAGDRAFVRDHVALGRLLLLAGAGTALLLWVTVDLSFPALAQRAGATLGIWFVLFALLALAQIPATLWLGIAQACGRYHAAFVWVVLPRVAAIVALAAGAVAGAGATATLATAVVLVVAGQWALAHTGRRAMQEVDAAVFAGRGQAKRVLGKNVSAGAIALVGMLVTIVPVTIVGRLLPEEVGHAHVIVSLSNAVGAFIVAAFFPASLALAERAREPRGLWRHCVRVARGVGLITLALIALVWLVFPVCAQLTGACTRPVFLVGTLVVVGAGLRLASLGAYHAAVYQGHPLYSLTSASAEAVAVTGVTWWAIGSWMLYALGVAFVVGGALRLAIAFTLEARWLAVRGT
jgi:hypothetical protein